MTTFILAILCLAPGVENPEIQNVPGEKVVVSQAPVQAVEVHEAVSLAKRKPKTSILGKSMQVAGFGLYGPSSIFAGLNTFTAPLFLGAAGGLYILSVPGLLLGGFFGAVGGFLLRFVPILGPFLGATGLLTIGRRPYFDSSDPFLVAAILSGAQVVGIGLAIFGTKLIDIQKNNEVQVTNVSAPPSETAALW